MNLQRRYTTSQIILREMSLFFLKREHALDGSHGVNNHLILNYWIFLKLIKMLTTAMSKILNQNRDLINRKKPETKISRIYREI